MKRAIRNFVNEWTINILILLFGTTTLVQAFIVPTGSMETTVKVGDHLLVDKLSYSTPGAISQYFLPYTPVQRGDIIVFRYPADISQNFVKRAMGVPGDHIRLKASMGADGVVHKQVFLNGKQLTEPYIRHRDAGLNAYPDNFPTGPPSITDRIGEVDEEVARAREYLQQANAELARVQDETQRSRLEAQVAQANSILATATNTKRGLEEMSRHIVDGELVVPPDYFFAMGDNRDDSLDSRYWGLVPRENIIGKPLLIFWSYDAETADLVDFTANHFIDLARNFFSKTRWDRELKLVRGYPVGR